MMKEQVNKSLRADLDTIGKIIANATLHIDFLNFAETQASNSDKSILKTYPLFFHVENAFWWVAILDLLKLYSKSKNDDYNLYSFIERVITNYEMIELENQMEESTLTLLNQLDSKSIQVDKIKKVRDKYIAHLDKKRMRVDLNLDNLNELLFMCQQVHDKLNFSFNFATTRWEQSWSQKGYQIFKNLSKYQQIRELTFSSSVDNKKCIDNQVLLDIIRETTSN